MSGIPSIRPRVVSLVTSTPAGRSTVRARLSAAEAVLLAGDGAMLGDLGQEGGVRVEVGVGEVVMEGATGAVMEAERAMRMLLKEISEKVMQTFKEESKAAEAKKTANDTKDPDMFLYSDEVGVLLSDGGENAQGCWWM